MKKFIPAGLAVAATVALTLFGAESASASEAGRAVLDGRAGRAGRALLGRA